MVLDYNVKLPKDFVPLVQGNWLKWSRPVYFSFMAAGLREYLDGTIPEPSTEGEQVEWREYNTRIIGTLGGAVQGPLAQEFLTQTTAHEAWTLLKKQTHPEGLLAKLISMRAALRTRFTADKPAFVTTAEIHDLLSSIYEGGIAPTQEEMFRVLVLNALDGTEYEWVRSDLLTRFADAETAPDEKEVIRVINAAGYEKRRAKQDQESVLKPTKGLKVEDQTEMLNCVVVSIPLRTMSPIVADLEPFL